MAMQILAKCESVPMAVPLICLYIFSANRKLSSSIICMVLTWGEDKAIFLTFPLDVDIIIERRHLIMSKQNRLAYQNPSCSASSYNVRQCFSLHSSADCVHDVHVHMKGQQHVMALCLLLCIMYNYVAIITMHFFSSILLVDHNSCSVYVTLDEHVYSQLRIQTISYTAKCMCFICTHTGVVNG